MSTDLRAKLRPATVHSRFRVTDGSCLDCAGDVAGSVRRLAGVRHVDVLTTSGLVVVDHDEAVTTEALQRAAAECGLVLAPATARPRPDVRTSEDRWWRRRPMLALEGAAMLLVAGLVLDKVLGLETAATLLYLATLVVGGFYAAREGLDALRRRQLTIATLLVVAALGAVALGVYEEAALLVVIFSLGEVLEEYASDRARGAIRALMALVPPTAQRLRTDGSTEAVAVEDLAPDDLVMVRPGDRLPTDGVVAAGTSSIDQSSVTGESLPVEVRPGATVFGGTVNGIGALEIRVTKEYADTTLARIIRQVEEAQAARGRAQRFADRFGAVYTPAMFVLAALVASVPTLLGGDPRAWTYRALIVLTVSCSCALVISVPVAVVAAITRAARDGILVKGGVYLEVLGAIRAVALDKTGTLTQGRPRVTDIVPLDGLSPEQVLHLAAGVEAASEHPLAAAILRAAEERGVAWETGRDLQAIPGVGVEATVGGERLFVGRPDPARLDGAVDTPELLEGDGKTVVAVVRDGQTIGLLSIADEVRPGASAAVAALRAEGIHHVLMLTGDNERAAWAVARQVGIDDWRAGLLPEGKTAAIQGLRAQYGRIAMVGDGINDAPAMATADLGIVMGAAGTDVALETADVALMADDLAKLPAAVRLSKRALGNIRQNITLSLASIALLIVAALAGWLTLTTGLLLNEGSAILIIANGLRLLAAPVDTAQR